VGSSEDLKTHYLQHFQRFLSSFKSTNFLPLVNFTLWDFSYSPVNSSDIDPAIPVFIDPYNRLKINNLNGSNVFGFGGSVCLDSPLWKWCKRRHNQKNQKWISNRYFHKIGNRNWVFAAKTDDNKLFPLFRMSSINITRHLKIINKANVYDKEFDEYFRKRKLGKARKR
jgi:hypothetical protein